MGKRTEDEIQQKLVELEVAMKQEQALKAAQAAADEVEDVVIVGDDPVGGSLSRMEAKIAGKEKAAKKKKAEVALSGDNLNAELLQMGGYVSLTAGFLILLSHIRVLPVYPSFLGANPGLLMIPLLVGIGMLIYNYKSRVAQITAGASFLALIFGVITSFTLGFYGTSLLEMIILTLPVVFGVVLLAKANVKRREAKESTKLLQ
jgi:ribonucleotide monophosphatase NagD (HAD superfamily)